MVDSSNRVHETSRSSAGLSHEKSSEGNNTSCSNKGADEIKRNSTNEKLDTFGSSMNQIKVLDDKDRTRNFNNIFDSRMGALVGGSVEL